MISLKDSHVWRHLAPLFVANLVLLLPPANFLRVGGALLLIGYLPGLSWVQPLLPAANPILRWTNAAALSYLFTLLVTLLLYYLPGSIQAWQVLVSLNVLAILPLFIFKKPEPWSQALSLRSLTPIALIILVALLLRAANLSYSEFQGDEALAMISAAEALEGHEDALFLRSKGPGEVLLPMALWRLTGIINEPMARLPFLAAILWALLTIYQIGELVGERLKRPDIGWLAATFFALSGFTVGFGRIVQYQALVLWMSSLAFLLILTWRQTKQMRLAGLGGLYLGAGLLAHYDTILVLPALMWLFVVDLKPKNLLIQEGFQQLGRGPLIAALRSGILFTGTLLFVAIPFYLPYSLDPQANRTGAYVEDRIGNELRNNLPDFFHFNTFYSSFYMIVLTGLLVFGLLLWWFWRSRRGLWWGALLLGIAIIAVIVNPTLLARQTFDLSFLPFSLLLLAAFLVISSETAAALRQGLIVWLAVPFLGYNFVVALGLTHIYTIVPAWSLLAAMAWSEIQLLPNSDQSLKIFPSSMRRFVGFIPGAILILFAAISTVFLWNAFIRHDVEYWQDYPAGQLTLFWSPYDEPPQAGFFGFAHRSGWKSIGQKIAVGDLEGDYDSNEEPDVTTWYTRGAPRACDPQPEYYFLADDLVDPIDVSGEIIETDYRQIGQVILQNQKQLRIMQQIPATLDLGDLDEALLAHHFDQTATPAAFARSARGSITIQANFSNLVQLIGYDLDTRRAHRGGRVPVTLYWQALSPIPASYQVFTHLENETVGVMAQADGAPVCWRYPTDVWRPGQIIADQHAIAIPPDAPFGVYPLQIGLYLADTFERLDVLDEAGNPAGTSLHLTTVEITQ